MKMEEDRVNELQDRSVDITQSEREKKERHTGQCVQWLDIGPQTEGS